MQICRQCARNWLHNTGKELQYSHIQKVNYVIKVEDCVKIASKCGNYVTFRSYSVTPEKTAIFTFDNIYNID